MRTGQQLARPTHVLGRMIEASTGGAGFTVTGTDWPTRDGTGIRDYIHVWDLARAHVRAVEAFDRIVAAGEPPGYLAVNLGCGTGVTVRELLTALATVLGRPLPHREGPARPGDVAGSWTRSERAGKLLGFTPELSVVDGIRHSLEWASRRDHVLRGHLRPASPVAAM